MRKHDQHNRFVTKTLSETAQAVKLCGKERELGDQRLMGLGSCCDVEVKKGGGERLEPLRVITSNPPQADY
jgi:hypothetical protein